MPAPYGVTVDGFSKKRFEELVAELKVEYAALFTNINTGEDALAGNLINIDSKALSDLWELGEAAYNAMYPATATGVALDNVSDLVGVKRLNATKSTVIASAKGNQGVVLPVGRLVEVTETLERFTSTVETTIDAANAADLDLSVNTVADSTDYTITINGTPFTHNSGGGATAITIMAGLKIEVDGGSEPVTFTDNLDGTAIIPSDDIATSYNGSVSANLTIDAVTTPLPMESINTGIIVGLAGTLVTIITPIANWTSVTNRLDATVGRNIETDFELRLRRSESLQIAGVATVEAIQARLKQVAGVTAALVIENDTFVVDGSGRPPKSFESVVTGGTDADVALEIWNSKPAGIETFGTTTEVIVDSQGNNQSINFSRATEVFLWVRSTITKNTEEVFPGDGVTQIIANILGEGLLHQVGADVIVQKFVGPTIEVTGIATVLIEIATSATAGGPPGAYQATNLTILSTEAAIFDSARISVVEV